MDEYQNAMEELRDIVEGISKLRDAAYSFLFQRFARTAGISLKKHTGNLSAMGTRSQ